MSKNKKQESDVFVTPKTLDQVSVGMTAWVTSVEVSDPMMRRRLQDLGIINGTRVVCKQSASKGDMKSFLVRGATIAIRKEDSSQIFVTTNSPREQNNPI